MFENKSAIEALLYCIRHRPLLYGIRIHAEGTGSQQYKASQFPLRLQFSLSRARGKNSKLGAELSREKNVWAVKPPFEASKGDGKAAFSRTQRRTVKLSSKRRPPKGDTDVYGVSLLSKAAGL
jgi:hypothetical protein